MSQLLRLMAEQFGHMPQQLRHNPEQLRLVSQLFYHKAKQYYLPKNDAGKQLWLQNFSNKLGLYKTKYNIQETQITDLATSLIVFRYWLTT
jgi:hypothetical protein